VALRSAVRRVAAKRRACRQTDRRTQGTADIPVAASRDDCLRRVIRDYMLTLSCTNAFHFGWLRSLNLPGTAEFCPLSWGSRFGNGLKGSGSGERIWQEAAFPEIRQHSVDCNLHWTFSVRALKTIVKRFSETSGCSPACEFLPSYGKDRNA
jgi:hypothetical protein